MSAVGSPVDLLVEPGARAAIAHVLAAAPRLTSTQLAVIRHASSMPVEEVADRDA